MSSYRQISFQLQIDHHMDDLEIGGLEHVGVTHSSIMQFSPRKQLTLCPNQKCQKNSCLKILKENIHVAHVLCLKRSFFLGKSHGSPTASLEKPHLLRGPPAELAGDAAPETGDENPCRTVHSNLDFGGKKYLQF